MYSVIFDLKCCTGVMWICRDNVSLKHSAVLDVLRPRWCARPLRWVLTDDHLRVLRAVWRLDVDLRRSAVPRTASGGGNSETGWRLRGPQRREELGRHDYRRQAVATSGLRSSDDQRPVPAVQLRQGSPERQLLGRALARTPVLHTGCLAGEFLPPQSSVIHPLQMENIVRSYYYK